MMSNQLLNDGYIYLKAPEPEDLDFMFEIENSAQACDAGSLATGPYSRYQIKRYIAESTNDIYTDHQLRLMITLATTGNIVGIIDVFSFDPRHKRAEIGIILSSSFRRQGIASTALHLLEQHCFHVLGIHQLYAYVREDNTACIKLLLKAGYALAGKLKDWVWMGTNYMTVSLFQKIVSHQ